jgi:hypothetical protein
MIRPRFAGVAVPLLALNALSGAPQSLQTRNLTSAGYDRMSVIEKTKKIRDKEKNGER